MQQNKKMLVEKAAHPSGKLFCSKLRRHPLHISANVDNPAACLLFYLEVTANQDHSNHEFLRNENEMWEIKLQEKGPNLGLREHSQFKAF